MTGRAGRGLLLAASLLAGAAACGSQILDGGTGGSSGDCPADAPIGGAPCGAPATCGYPGAGCGLTFACAGGVWQLLGDGCPAPPPTDACPSSIPGMSTPCKKPGKTCSYSVPGDCPGLYVATCAGTGWSIADESPPCMPSPCPTTEPVAGSACAGGASCTYTVTPPGCPPETQNATCDGGVWSIATEGSCGP